jgi:tetratricopeptide (TPR) repeat protein
MTKKIYFLFLIFLSITSFGQANLTFTRFQMPFDGLYRSPAEKDKIVLKTDGYLTTQKPDSKNFDKYYHLASSLWELNKTKEAEQLFLNIVNSTETPGFGGLIANYKTGAAVYLAKTYILQKQYDKAFKYLEDARLKQKDEYVFLYACCYEGLKKYNEALELLLPSCFNKNHEITVGIIKKMYAQNEIKEYLIKAENSIEYTFANIPSYSYKTTYSSDNKIEKTDTLVYYSDVAKINLFGKRVAIPTPTLEKGEEMTKDRFIKEFKDSNFYIELAKAAGLSY